MRSMRFTRWPACYGWRLPSRQPRAAFLVCEARKDVLIVRGNNPLPDRRVRWARSAHLPEDTSAALRRTPNRQYISSPPGGSVGRTDWNRTRDKGRAASGSSIAMPPSEMFKPRVRAIFMDPVTSSQEILRTPASSAYRRECRRSLRFKALQLVCITEEEVPILSPQIKL